MIILPKHTGLPPDMDKRYRNAFEGIFNTLYEALAPDIQIMDPEEIKLWGFHHSEVPEYNKQYRTGLKPRLVSIATMVDWAEQGVHQNLGNGKDAITIYKAICEYLDFWRDLTVGKMYGHRAPIKDLKSLSDFANILYPIAMRYGLDVEVMQSEQIDQIFGGQLDNEGVPYTVNISDFYNNNNNTNKKKDDIKVIPHSETFKTLQNDNRFKNPMQKIKVGGK